MASCQVTPATQVTFKGSFHAPRTEAPGLPAGFPASVGSPMAWTSNDFKMPAQYIHVLKTKEIEEIEAAVAYFKALNLDGDLVTRDRFPLPTLGTKLDQIRHDIHHGKGFGVIRGLDPQKYQVEDLTMIHLGLQVYIANRQGRQDSHGNMLVHIVADKSSELAAGHHRHSTAPITFHNEEAGDVVSWLTRSTAASDGRCIIASVYAIYNMLAADRPDLVRVLAGSDWPFAIPKFQCRPVLFHHDGRLIMNFGRTPLLGSDVHPRPSQLPQLSARQVEALDAVEKLACATELQIATQPGDLHFINNLTVLHRREGFVNGPSKSQRRHLVRMRLRDDELGWAIPEALQEEWAKAFDDGMGPRMWHLQPMPKGYFPLRSHPN